MRLTNHSLLRMKERVGLSKPSAERLAERALERGLTVEECSGVLKRYMKGRTTRFCKGDEMRIYADKLFVFHGTVLITVFRLPVPLIKIARKLERRRRDKIA